MKKLFTSLIVMIFIASNLFAGATSIPVASGASATTINGYLSSAVSGGNTDITLLFAKGGTWGSSGGEITIAVPAGVTKLTLTKDPGTSGAIPVLYLATLTYSDPLMTGGIAFDSLKLITGTANKYLVSAANFPASATFSNCWIQGYRSVVKSSTTTTNSSVNFYNNILKNITNDGFISVSAGTISNVNIRNNTFINCGGNASGATTDYFIDFRSANSVTSQIVFANNTIYFPTVQGRGLFRLSGSFTTGYVKFNNNLFANGNGSGIALNCTYGTYTGLTTAADSTNYYALNFTSTSNITGLTLTSYAVGSTTLFKDPTNDDFTINDQDFPGKKIAGDPRWFPEELTSAVTISTTVSPENSGIVAPGSSTVNSGSSVTFTATKNFGYNFKEWRNATTDELLSTNNPFSFTASSDITIKAVFETVNTFNFTLNIVGSQWGQVSVTPAPTGGKYEEGTNVSLTVEPNAVTNFLYWEDASTVTTRSVVVDGDKTLTATFDEKSFITGWDFKVAEPKSNRTGDYYASSSNKGVISLYDQAGTAVSWLSHTGWGSPSTPCAIKWTAGASFASNQRYFQASFATTGYQNVQVKSQISGSYQYYTNQKLQASLNGTDYTDLTSIDLTGNTWKDLNYTLPAEYENQAVVYIRWVANTSSTLNGNSVDNDGTGLTNVFVFADLIPVVDTNPPVLISSVPAEGASNVSANGNIILTFNERVILGTGNCTLDSKTLTPVLGSRTASFAYSKLSYNTDYTFTVPAGALKDMSGNDYAGMTLHFRTMNRPIPTAKVFDAVIAKDGTGDYTTVQAAINAAPAGRVQPWLIFIKNGTYSGHVDIPSTKPYIHLIGQTRDGVIISDARLCGTSTAYPDSAVYSVDPGATVVVKSANCYFENICFENKFGYDNNSGPQALALYTNNDRIALKNCWLRSYQDTYLTTYGHVSDRHYLQNCRIEGAVDFIYGGGDVFFDQCTIYCKRASGGYIVAPSHQDGTQWGYVFSNCTIDGPSSSYQTYMGRPWVNKPKASFFNTTWKIMDYPAGWYYKMGAIPAIFADYNSMDNFGSPLDLSQRIEDYQYDVKDAGGNVINTVYGKAKKSFTDEEAAQYTYENVVSGSDGWDPRSLTETTYAPANALISKQGDLTWIGDPYAICYIILKNDVVIGFTASTEFSDNNFNKVKGLYKVQAASNEDVYKIIAVSESGALSTPTIVTESGVYTDNIASENNKVFAYFNADKNLVISNLKLGDIVSIYSVTGMLLNKQKATKNALTFHSIPSCIVKISSTDGTSALKVMR